MPVTCIVLGEGVEAACPSEAARTFFAAKFREQLLTLRGDAGARSIIDAHRNETVAIPFEAAAFDVDTDAAISL